MGPACGLWFPLGTGEAADAAVERLVRLVARPGRFNDRFGFNTRDTRPIGGREYPLPACLCCGLLRPSVEVEGYETVVEEAFGFRPDPQALSLSVGANILSDHRILADVAAYLAEQTGGVIDLDHPPWSLKQPPWSDGGLPGQARVLFRDGTPGLAPKLVLDAVAMRAWSEHSGCMMPK